MMMNSEGSAHLVHTANSALSFTPTPQWALRDRKSASNLPLFRKAVPTPHRHPRKKRPLSWIDLFFIYLGVSVWAGAWDLFFPAVHSSDLSLSPTSTMSSHCCTSPLAALASKTPKYLILRCRFTSPLPYSCDRPALPPLIPAPRFHGEIKNKTRIGFPDLDNVGQNPVSAR